MILWVEAVGCTNGCRGCQLGSPPPYPCFCSAADLRRLAATWGPLVPLDDPTIHPEFPELLARPVTSPDTTYLGTNGVGIAQAAHPDALFSRLRAHGYQGLYFALHGLAYWHDWYAGRQGAFQAVLQASRRASAAGFQVHWEVLLNRRNLDDMALLAEVADQTFGGSPHLNLLNHRMHPHLWWYESLRPTLHQVQERVPADLFPERWRPSLEAWTEASWLRAWQNRSSDEAFVHPFEPRGWPVSPSFENRCISITRDGHVYLDPQCSPPGLLGRLPEDRATVMGRLQHLAEPHPDLRHTWPRHLRDEDRDLLHAAGYSVRYKAVTESLRAEDEQPDGIGVLDFCGHF